MTSHHRTAFGLIALVACLAMWGCVSEPYEIQDYENNKPVEIAEVCTTGITQCITNEEDKIGTFYHCDEDGQTVISELCGEKDASGEYVEYYSCANTHICGVCLDSDDVFTPTAVEQLLRAYDERLYRKKRVLSTACGKQTAK